MSRRPRFAVVTAVVTILAIVGAIARLFRPLIPPPAHTFYNYSDKGGFLQQAQNEPIRWLPLLDTDFSEAMQLGRPVLLLTGAEWSRDGRLADRRTFSDGDVQALIGSDYLPVRIDCDESPEWLNAYFPVSRYSLDLDRGCQTFILSPKGLFYDYLQSGALSEHSETLDVTEDLLAGKVGADFAGQRSSASVLLEKDINALMSRTTPAPPSFRNLVQTLESSTDRQNGGFPEDGVQHLEPNAYRFEIMSGLSQLARDGLGPLLRSPIVNWMDGGFFRMANQDWSDVQYDQVSVENAGMMLVCAQYGLVTKDPYATLIAKNTFDCLAGPFLQDYGLICSDRVGDERDNGRSARYSFEEKDFRSFWPSQLLSERDRKWAVTNLNMSLDRNAQLTPYVSNENIALYNPARLQWVLHEMRASKTSSPAHYGLTGYADVNGFVCARLIECARLWGDKKRLETALGIRNRLERLHYGNDMQHKGDARQHKARAQKGPPELTDYLGYADAALQDYLATGNVYSFEGGLGVLVSARSQFELSTPGAWLMARSSPRGLPRDYLAPEVADNLYESCTAREIRLMSAYSLLLGGNPRYASLARSLDADAKAAIAQFTPAASLLGLHASGFFCAAKAAMSGEAYVVVGPDADSVAGRLAVSKPFALVAVAKGPVRPDLQARGPGVYKIQGGKVARAGLTDSSPERRVAE